MKDLEEEKSQFIKETALHSCYVCHALVERGNEVKFMDNLLHHGGYPSYWTKQSAVSFLGKRD